MLSGDYIETFLTSHHPYDYAREHIIYPRRDYYREHTDDQIKTLSQRVPFAKTPIGLKRCRPSMLEYHLRESSKNMTDGFPWWKVEWDFDYGAREEFERIYGSRWILVCYYDDAFVNFMQFDIDRHEHDSDETAQKAVTMLDEAAQYYGFEIVWTTSPGYIGVNGAVVHGLYAWIKLDRNHFVMDIRPYVQGLLYQIGLDDIAKHHEGAYLKRKKLVRLPGQFNVELADPVSFSKIHNHTPAEASIAFQNAWAQATPMSSKILTSITPPSPQTKQRQVHTHSSVTLPPLPPHGDTFEALLKWGRLIVNKVYPEIEKRPECVAELVATAEENLPAVSRTRQDKALLRRKAEGIIKYLWNHTKPEWVGKGRAKDEDGARFALHAAYIRDNRQKLLSLVPSRLCQAASAILDLMLKFNGRVAAKMIYHAKKTPICTCRNWKIIRGRWGVVTLVEYVKASGDKGTCKQWGFACVEDEDTTSSDA